MPLGFGDLLSLGVKGASAYFDRQSQRNTSKQLESLASRIPEMASPYPTADRQLAAQQLRGFMTGERGPSDLPGYAQMVEAQKRVFNKSGKAFSGNAATDLATMLSGEQQKHMQFLSQIAGTQFNPAGGADLLAQINAQQIQNDRQSNPFLDFATDAVDLLGSGKGSTLMDFFSGGKEGTGIFDSISNALGDFGATSGLTPGMNFGAFDDVLSGGLGGGAEGGFSSLGDLFGTDFGSSLKDMFGMGKELFGGGNLFASPGLGAFAQAALPALILAMGPRGGLFKSFSGAYNPVTGKGSMPGDPIPTLDPSVEGALGSTALTSFTGMFDSSGNFEGGADEGEARNQFTIANPRFGANILPDGRQVYIPESALAGGPNSGIARAQGHRPKPIDDSGGQ